jgi:hypothetical protein
LIFTKFPSTWFFLVLAWWSGCGAVMMSIDYYTRKRRIYLRFRNRPPGKNSVLGVSLRQTLCGTMLYIAMVRYFKENRAVVR